MGKIYIDSPYLKDYIVDIDHIRNINNHIYAKLVDEPCFLGTNNVKGDIFTVDNSPCNFYKPSGKEYIEISDTSKKSVNIKIDWENRLKLMQDNLAIGILRLLILSDNNLKIDKYKVEPSGSYINLLNKDISFKSIADLEELSNYLITSNLEVENKDGSINIFRLGEIDYDGPSLKRTGEIGFLIIKNVTKTLNGIRINIASGTGAYKDYRKKLDMLNNIKNYLNLKDEDEIFAAIKKLKA